MDNMNEIVSVNVNEVENLVIELRGQKVLLDRDVATLYGTETREINKAVRNNPDKFPNGYCFPLDINEKKEVVENFHHLSNMKFSKVPPRAFTERGLYMLATILKSPRASQTTIAIIEAFTRCRERSREDTPKPAPICAQPTDLCGILERFMDMSNRQMELMGALFHGKGAGTREEKEGLSCEEYTTLIPGANEYREKAYALCDEIILRHGNLRSRHAVLAHIYGVMGYPGSYEHSDLRSVDWEEEKALFKLDTGYKVISRLGMLANREDGYPAKGQLLKYLSSFLEAIKGHANG